MKIKWIIGIDEVGRGPIAGPVAVCVCSMLFSNYKKFKWENLNDSKKMSEKNREIWFDKAKDLKKCGLIDYIVVYRSNAFIDKNGISTALKECIDEALEKLNLKSAQCIVLLDGSLRAPIKYKNQETIIKGDQKKKIISLASVIAKVSRDKKMVLLHKKYPKYSWAQNKGYGTKAHYEAIESQGITNLHRKNFLTW